jgi:uncharacterized protein (DUF433 family)
MRGGELWWRRRPYASPMSFARISIDNAVMGGVACIAGTRIPVETVVGMLSDGMTVQEIVEDFPQLSAADVAAARSYARLT